MSAPLPDRSERELRRAVVETAQAMNAQGLSPRRTGNVSARLRKGGMLITPSGVAYEALNDDSIVLVGDNGETPPCAMKPSSEWRMHAAIYRAKPEAGAIVHCHSINATALACAGKAIPAFHYMVTMAGGSDIPLAPYAMFGTQQLADGVVMALKNRRATLMAHHGQIACGADPADALDLAGEVETLADMYIRTLQIGGGPVLDDEEMARVIEKFDGYGQD